MCSPAFAASRLYQGMDVSSWQGDIDFQAVRAAGIQAVYLRTGVGLEYVDPYFQSNYEKALDAGLNLPGQAAGRIFLFPDTGQAD